ncbi:MAG TPA: FHA domain-containing protein [Myxococcota bacterium]|nr:FHA domain-containing protein [Myxococcota bacterium]
MPEEDKEASSFMKLGDFVEDCMKLDEKAFIQRHAEAYFLHHGPIGKLQAAQVSHATLSSEFSGTSPDRPFNPKADFLVFEVKQRVGSDSDDTIWLGRSDSNDIIINDASVSAVHAFIRKGDGGGYFLQDMNSMNGSFVDDERVPAQGVGGPLGLRTGARVVLGSVAMSFLQVAEFRSLIRRLLG